MKRTISAGRGTWSAVALAAAVCGIVGCSSSASSPPPGDAGASGAQSEAGGGSGGSSGGGGSGLPACVSTIGTNKSCSAPMSAAMCAQSGGTSAPTCPSDNLTGCCQYNGNGGIYCYYGGSAASDQATCTNAKGAWTTTVPAY